MPKKTRLVYIDLLKILALLCMIVAHVNPPSWIVELRNFDVVLMVMCSGTLAYYNHDKNENIIPFLKKRMTRLIIPTYIFLCVYFAFSYLIGQRQSLHTIFDTYLFQQSGIGYTWIILIYLLCAVATPFVKKLEPTFKGWTVWIILLIIQELLCYYEMFVKYSYIESVICYIIPYVFAYWLGYWINSYKFRQRVRICLTGLVIFAVYAIGLSVWTGEFVYTSLYKYPPRFYYLSYGVGIGLLIYLTFQNYLNKKNEPKIFEFIASSTLWIYLWHIMIVKIMEHMPYEINWILKCIIASLFAILITIIQNRIVDIINKKNPKLKGLTNYLRG